VCRFTLSLVDRLRGEGDHDVDGVWVHTVQESSLLRAAVVLGLTQVSKGVPMSLSTWVKRGVIVLTHGPSRTARRK